MHLFIIGDFFRRRRWRRADDEMPAGPLLQMLLFWTAFGTAVLFGSLSVTATLSEEVTTAVLSAVASAASLAAAVVL